MQPDFALDLGCGWLHSADRNPWVAIAQAQGYTIDKTPPPWSKPALQKGFSLADQRDFSAAMNKFHDDVAAAAGMGPMLRPQACSNRMGAGID